MRSSSHGVHPRLDRKLALHPATMLVGRFDGDVVACRSVLQSADVHKFHESAGVLIEAIATPQGMGLMGLLRLQHQTAQLAGSGIARRNVWRDGDRSQRWLGSVGA
ncbi:hypothetical protein [Mycobacterium leprae]|uniref:hypothetical protein n=1 Tax=Mycobacterium leprae TaxID=1769 RepID=UPI0011AEA50F|nr:hypothetical protein [Mycobacterium leprae]